MTRTSLPINDQPLCAALARDELIHDFQAVFGVNHQQASLLCLAALVMLLNAQHQGELTVHVPPGSTRYHVNGQALQPFIQALAPHREAFLAQQHDPHAALGSVQGWLKASLHPRAVRTSLP